MKSNYLKETPMFPPEVYDNLPSFLKLCTDQSKDARDKDILLCSLLPVAGLCLSEAKGKYESSTLYPTLYFFITAPAASNKGLMKYARHIAQPLQEELLSKSKALIKDYKAAYAEWQKRKKADASQPPPAKPPQLALIIPGNSTSAAFYSLLNDNKGKGLVIETEADTFANSLDNKFGNFNDVLRVAYHHETLSLSRKGNDEYVEIKTPRLAILLTGTPEQVIKVIPSTGNGLFSRFGFYGFQRPLKWKDITPCYDCEDLDSFFYHKGVELKGIAEQVTSIKPEFFLTSEQFTHLNRFFESKIERIKLFEGEDAASSVYRLGSISFRVAMILTILRYAEKGPIPQQLICEDIDFTTTLQLADVLFEHTMVVFSSLPKTSKARLKVHLRRFYEALPKDVLFTRKTANEVGAAIHISTKSVGNYLNELEQLGYIEPQGHGKFRKVQQES